MHAVAFYNVAQDERKGGTDVMRSILKGLAIGLGALLLAGLAVVWGARFKDGPLGPIPGGPLVAGPLVATPVSDWGFVADVETIEMQLDADEHRSRTTWILALDGAAYLPVSLGFPPGKAWHLIAAQEGAGLVRVSGTRYPVTLVRVEDAELMARLDEANRAKYPPAPGSDEGSWYFELTYRAPG